MKLLFPKFVFFGPCRLKFLRTTVVNKLFDKLICPSYFRLSLVKTSKNLHSMTGLFSDQILTFREYFYSTVNFLWPHSFKPYHLFIFLHFWKPHYLK